MLYRWYKAEDFAALYAIEEVCFQPPHRFGRGYIRQLIRQRDAATWIAEDGGRMAGFGIVEWSEEPVGTVAYVQTLEVLPDGRGQGVGGELLRCLEKDRREKPEQRRSGCTWMRRMRRRFGCMRRAGFD